MNDEPKNLELWDAINAYAIACGGDPSQNVYGNTARQDAVNAIEAAVDKIAADAATHWRREYQAEANENAQIRQALGVDGEDPDETLTARVVEDRLQKLVSTPIVRLLTDAEIEASIAEWEQAFATMPVLANIDPARQGPLVPLYAERKRRATRRNDIGPTRFKPIDPAVETFLVWDELNGEPGEGKRIEAWGPQEAAERYAKEDHDGHIDGLYEKRHPIMVAQARSDGNVQWAEPRRFWVTMEATPTYVARGAEK